MGRNFRSCLLRFRLLLCPLWELESGKEPSRVLAPLGRLTCVLADSRYNLSKHRKHKSLFDEIAQLRALKSLRRRRRDEKLFDHGTRLYDY